MAKTERVAVPVRGAGCISILLRMIWWLLCYCPREGCGLHLLTFGQWGYLRMSCCPREGCGLHLSRGAGLVPAPLVAVPVRGAGCISKRVQTRISIFVGSSQPVSVVYHTSVQKGKLFCAYQTETADLF